MAARTHEGDVQHDYEALLIFSSKDEELGKTLWTALKCRGYHITQHQDPDGPFTAGRSAYDNMVDAIERSKKLLVLFTKAAVDSGFVSLEMMLGIEKSRRTGRMCLLLLNVGQSQDQLLSKDQIDSLKNGLLGCVPDIKVDMSGEGWARTLLQELRAPRPDMNDLLPAGNLAHGQVFSHYVGYLQHILPEVEGKLNEWKETNHIYRQNPGKLCRKYLMLIPHSCDTEKPIECTCSGIKIEHVDMLKISVVHGEKKREYNPTIYRASKIGSGEEPIYFIGEFAKVLHCACMLKNSRIAEVDTRLEATRFYHTMNNLLNHKENPRCNGKARLLCYSDCENSATVLWSAMTQEIEMEQEDTLDLSQVRSRFNSLEPNIPGQYFDATITCLSPAEEDGELTYQIAKFLHDHERQKQVIQRDALDGKLEELQSARWNIFVMSRHAFDSEFLGIDMISAIQRCAHNKCIQILPVITGMSMDEVPESLKWVTMINTEQHNYKELILCHIEGKPVHLQQKMPAGDVSTGLAWAYLLNYLPIQLGETTEDGLDFEGRSRKHLTDKQIHYGCLPYFYIIVSSTGEVIKDDNIENLGRAEPPIKRHQAGTKDREYYINMFRYKEVCFISEALTPGITLNTMANNLQFAGIEPGPMLEGQIKSLADLIEIGLRNQHYIEVKGDFRDRFRLIRYDTGCGRSLGDVIGEKLSADLISPSTKLIYAEERMDIDD